MYVCKMSRQNIERTITQYFKTFEDLTNAIYSLLPTATSKNKAREMVRFIECSDTAEGGGDGVGW